MIKKMIVTIFVTLLIIISSYNLAMSNQLSEFSPKKNDVNQVESFFDDIFSYNCEQIDQDKNVSLIFLKSGDTWTLNNIPEIDIEKTTNKFIIKFTKKEDEGFGVLKKENNAWHLQILTKSMYVDTICSSQDDFVFELSESIKPRIKNEYNKLYSTIDTQNKKIKKIYTKYNAEKSMAERSRKESKGLLFRLSQRITKIDKLEALIEKNNLKLDQQIYISETKQKKLELLNLQTVKLREKISGLREIIDDSQDATALEDARMQTSQLRDNLNSSFDKYKELESKTLIQLEALGTNLNLALARVAAEQRKVAAGQKKITEFEAKEKLILAEEAKDLKKFRSQFFGELRKVMEGQEGVRIVGDRFVFSSDVLFSVGSANLGSMAKTEINKVAKIINQIAGEIPDGIDWILRVDGHTDRIPFSGFGKDYKDNWELSQARALSVVRYLMDDLKIPANRLAANGFGEFQPIDGRDTPEAYKTNRRIELKFTEK